jgi:hypothetical protein
LVDLAKRSKVVAELETFKLFRAYHADTDQEAISAINATIAEEIGAWPQ